FGRRDRHRGRGQRRFGVLATRAFVEFGVDDAEVFAFAPGDFVFFAVLRFDFVGAAFAVENVGPFVTGEHVGGVVAEERVALIRALEVVDSDQEVRRTGGTGGFFGGFAV